LFWLLLLFVAAAAAVVCWKKKKEELYGPEIPALITLLLSHTTIQDEIMAEITHGPVLPTVEHPWLVLEL
jgi:hypothetical protein